MKDSISKRHLTMLNTSLGEEVMALFADDDIIEIMLNPGGELWAESLTKGKFNTQHGLTFAQAENIIKLVAAHQRAIASFDHPEVACELPGSGARFQAWLPPVVTSACFTIRKHVVRELSLDDYVKSGGLSAENAETLRTAVREKKNIIIAGGTGSGKTTIANALLQELSNTTDRLLVLEDLPELQIAAKDCVKLRTCETKTMRDLVKGVMRMRPDRIIIGEVRDGAALELLKAWNTGHPGGLCTVHANSAEATISRLEDLIQEVVNVVPKRLLQEAIDMIVFMQRNKAGKHCVKEIKLL